MAKLVIVKVKVSDTFGLRPRLHSRIAQLFDEFEDLGQPPILETNIQCKLDYIEEEGPDQK